ncbi:MAG TPA: F0F1 ATP synthase subunit delta [Gaiellaceae bacterium]|nr:F0F1 ATP synthase subunit delta [Gaiellaceae bacterium]
MSVVHRVYARALYDAAREAGRVDTVRGELGDFVAQVRAVPELRAVLRNPQLDPAAKAAVLDAILEDADELVRNFLRLLAEKNRIGEVEEVEREFERLVAREEGQLTVSLTTAYELSDEEARRIVDQIAKASGRPVEARRAVDPSLIGGFVLQAGSFRVDASVRGRLDRLRRQLVTRS